MNYSLGWFLLTVAVAQVQAQNNLGWTWTAGSNVLNPGTTYGTFGVENSANNPRARSGHCMVYLPQTNSIYVAHGFDSAGTSMFADMWRFNLTSNMWAWVGGTSTLNAIGVYGTKGVAASSNFPPPRAYFGMVADANGFIYLYGGKNGWYWNDLWLYNTTSTWFTWISGSTSNTATGNYGTRGVEAPSNIPGGRGSAGTVYHPRTNSIYVYGGDGFDTTTTLYGTLSDLWRYNLTSGMWAWLAGPSSMNQNAVFNTINVQSPTTNPGSGRSYGMAINPNNDMIYQFGGSRQISGNLYNSNALFCFNITSGQWAWISGSSSTSPTANYGTINVEAPTNVPPTKSNMVMVYHPASNNIIIYGDNRNDLWRFNITSNLWAMAQGTNAQSVAPSWGTLGVSTSTNLPGCRQNAAAAIHPNDSTLYYHGGRVISAAAAGADLWQFILDTAPLVVTTTSTSTTSTISTISATSTSTSTTSTPSTSTTSTSTTGTTSRTGATASTTSAWETVATTTLDTLSQNPVETLSATNQQQEPGQTTTIMPTSVDAPNASGSNLNSSLMVYAGAGGGGVFALIVAVAAIVVVRRRAAKDKMRSNIDTSGVDSTNYTQTGMGYPQTGMNITQLSVYQTGMTMPQYSTMTSNNMTQTTSPYGVFYQPQFNTTVERQSMYSQPPSESTVNSLQQFRAMPTNSFNSTSYGMGIPNSPEMERPITYSGQGTIVDEKDQLVNYNQLRY